MSDVINFDDSPLKLSLESYVGEVKFEGVDPGGYLPNPSQTKPQNGPTGVVLVMHGTGHGFRRTQSFVLQQSVEFTKGEELDVTGCPLDCHLMTPGLLLLTCMYIGPTDEFPPLIYVKGTRSNAVAIFRQQLRECTYFCVYTIETPITNGMVWQEHNGTSELARFQLHADTWSW